MVAIHPVNTEVDKKSNSYKEEQLKSFVDNKPHTFKIFYGKLKQDKDEFVDLLCKCHDEELTLIILDSLCKLHGGFYAI